MLISSDLYRTSCLLSEDHHNMSSIVNDGLYHATMSSSDELHPQLKSVLPIFMHTLGSQHDKKRVHKTIRCML